MAKIVSQELKYRRDLLIDWLVNAALPIWSTRGLDLERGGFFETIDLDGSRPKVPRRARVQARQSFVFSMAGRHNWHAQWEAAAKHGLYFLQSHYRRPDGLFRTLINPDGEIVNDDAMTYDHAFIMLASAALYGMRPDYGDVKYAALSVLKRLKQFRKCDSGGFFEHGHQRFLSNPHMHLLEAAIAWIEVDGSAEWYELGDEIVGLCIKRFVDPLNWVVRERFNSEWRPLIGDSFEPGHQFEWSWLLMRWSLLRGQSAPADLARKLYESGNRGLDVVRNVAVDIANDGVEPITGIARLWPQTERLKASLIMAETAGDQSIVSYTSQAIEAADSLWSYLQTPLKGLWHDKMLAGGNFAEEAAPASSFYHIVCAIAYLQDAVD